MDLEKLTIQRVAAETEAKTSLLEAVAHLRDARRPLKTLAKLLIDLDLIEDASDTIQKIKDADEYTTIVEDLTRM